MKHPKLSKVERAAIRWAKAMARDWGEAERSPHWLPADRALARAVAELLKARKGKRR